MCDEHTDNKPRGLGQECEFLDRMGDGFVAIDEAFRIEYVNDAAVDLLDAEDGDFAGKTGDEIFPDAGETILDSLHSIIETGETDTFEHYDDHRETWWEITAAGSESGLSLLLRDITDKKDQRHALKRFRTALDQSNDAIFIIDPTENTPIDVNKTACERLGYEREELLSLSPWEIEVTVGGPAEWEDHFETVRETGSVSYEGEHRRKDGSSFPVEVEISVVEGDEEYIVAIARDRTERKKREREIEERERRYQTLFEKAPEAILVHDMDGNILEANQRETEYLGYTEDELTSMNTDDIDVTHSYEEIKNLWAEIDFGETKKVEIRLKRKDDSVFPAEVWLNKIRYDGDVGILAFARDITERKEQEREINRLTERLELAVEGANLGVWDWDMSTDELAYNDQYVRMLGYTEAEFGHQYKSWENRVHPEDIDRAEATIEEHVQEETAYFETEYRLQTADGDWKWILGIGRVVDRDEAGDPVRAVGIHFDISDRIQAEQSLQEERERYTRLFELLPLPVVHATIQDSEPIIENVNPAFEQTFGYESETIKQERLSDIFQANREDQEDVSTITGQLIQEGSIETEVTRDTVDGIRTFRLNVNLYVVSSGSIEAYGVYTDITERQQREEAFLESIRDIITLIDEDGIIRYESPAVEEIQGYSPEERVGDAVLDYIHPDDRDRIESLVNNTLTGDTHVQTEEIRVMDKDGTWRWVESRAKVHTPVVGLNGVLVSTRDISERKRREQELETVLEHMDDAVFVHEEGGRFILVNQTAVRRYGYEEEELLDMTPEDLDVPDEVEEIQTRVDRIKEDGVFRFETEHQLASGDSIPVEINSSSITFRGNPAILSIARDISERKKRLERLQKRERILRDVHTTTEEFIAADTEAEVYERIVSGLSHALDHQYIGVRRFDSEAGVLKPESMSPALAEEFVGPKEVEPGEHPLWQAFVDQETRTIRDVPSEVLSDSSDGSITAVLAVPIGDSGLILLGDGSEQSFDEIDIEMVELLAKTAGAMLDRLHREEEMVALDQEITTMKTRMQEMENWMDAIETIHQHVARSDTQAGFETVVCEELLAAEPIDFAWIGRPETKDRDLSPSAWAGKNRGYLDRVGLAEGEDMFPCQQAAIERETVAISNVSTRVSEGEWAKTALTANFRSLVSIPIEHEDVLYGVLTVYSESESVFGQLERSLLEDLGSVLANAYRMVTVRTGSTEAEIEELEFAIKDQSYPLFALAKATETTLSFDTILEETESTVRILLSVDEGDAETLFERASSILTIEAVEWFGDPDHQQVVITMQKPFVAGAIEDYGGQVVASIATPERATVRIHQSTAVPARPLIEWLQTQYDAVDLVARRSHQQLDTRQLTSPQTLLTERQYEVLKAAYFGGYYETPKGVTGEEIANSFDISRPAVYNHLQAAQRRLLKRVFGVPTEREGLTT